MFKRKKSKTIKIRKDGVNRPRLRSGNLDYQLLITVAFLSLFGLLMIFSASAILSYTRYEDTFFYFKRQIFWLIAGSGLGYLLYRMPLQTLKKAIPIILIGVLLSIVYMLPEALSPVVNEETGEKAIEMPFVSTRNGATRWINFEIFEIQPAELLKFSFLIFTAYWFSLSVDERKKIDHKIAEYNKRGGINIILSLFYTFLPYIVLGVISILLLAQKDLDALIIVGIVFLAANFIAATKKAQVYLTVGLGIIAVIFGSLLTVSQDYRKSRIDTFVEILVDGEPSYEGKTQSGFQVWNGLIAIGSGGLFGLGYNESRQKLFFLQEAAYTDSIFAVIGEEFGLMGCLVIVISFLYLASRGINIAKESKDRFSSLLAISITLWIVLQAFLNIAANLAIIPFAGLALPFFTYGGSITIATFMGIGILLNISSTNSTSKTPMFLRKAN